MVAIPATPASATSWPDSSDWPGGQCKITFQGTGDGDNWAKYGQFDFRFSCLLDESQGEVTVVQFDLQNVNTNHNLYNFSFAVDEDRSGTRTAVAAGVATGTGTDYVPTYASTTLQLRALVGDVRIVQGKVHINGQSAKSTSEYGCGIDENGFTQNARMFPCLGQNRVWHGSISGPAGFRWTDSKVGSSTRNLRAAACTTDNCGSSQIVQVVSDSNTKTTAWPKFPGAGLTPAELFGGVNLSQACIRCLAGILNFTDWPVEASSGNFWHTFEGLQVPGRGPALDFSFTYNSLAASANGPLGYGWTHSYLTSLTIGSGNTPVTVNQENGSQTTFTLGTGGYTAPLRVQATLTHNGDGTWTFVRDERTTFTFDSAGKLTAITDLNGYETTLTYSSGKLSTVTDPADRTLSFTYSGSLVAEVADSASRSIEFTYDASGNLETYTDALGGVTSMTYDASHRLTELLDPNQQSSGDPQPLTNVYTSGKVTSQTDFEGRTTTFDYTSIVGATKVTDPKGNVTVQQYVNGFPVSITRGYGTSSAATWTITYDQATGLPVQTTDPLNHTATNEYDEEGNLVSRTDALDRETTYTYDSLGNVLTTTDPEGVTTTNTYDSAGNPLTTSTPLVGQTGVDKIVSYAYGDTEHPGDVTTMTDPDEKVWEYTYDTYGNQTSNTDPLGNVTEYCYDTIGRRTRTITPRGVDAGDTCTISSPQHTYLYTYNELGDVLTSTDPLGHVETLSYDLNRNLVAREDAEENETTYEYNLVNELVVTTRPDTTTLQSDYWPDGSLKSQTDGAGETTSYAYGPLGHLTTVTDPLSRVTTYTHNAVGKLVSKQDPGGDCSATPKTGCTTYVYDAADQLTSITYSDGTTPNVTDITYDDNGRRTEMTDGTGTSSWEWDSLGRLTSHTNGDGATVGYEYDLRGNVTEITYPGSTGSVTRVFDDAGRLESVTDWSSNTTTFTYDADGELETQEYPNGLTTTFSRDDADRLTGIDVEDSSSTLLSFDYTRDDVDRVISVTSTGVPSDDHTFTYTPIGQLATIDSASYDYDLADNLTDFASGPTQTFDVANQLDERGTTTYDYDSRGNRTTVTPSGGPTTTLAYDQANRLTGYGSTATYEYDGDGLRMSKTVSSTTTQQTWDVSGELPLLLVDGTTSYINGPSGFPIAQVTSGGTVSYYHQDQLGSTPALSNSSGSIAATYTYDPFGFLTASTGSLTTPLGYNGQYTDAETGLLYLRARFYDPVTAQFLTRDPIEQETRSPYAYVYNDPVNATDPTGYGIFGDIWGGIKSAANFVIKNPGTIATAGAIVACVAGSLGLCGAATAGAFIVRASDRIVKRGFGKSLRGNLTDALVTTATFGAVAGPSAAAFTKGGIMEGAAFWQRGLLKGASALPDFGGWLSGFSRSGRC